MMGETKVGVSVHMLCGKSSVFGDRTRYEYGSPPHSLKRFAAPGGILRAFNTIILSHEVQSYQHSRHTLPTVADLSRRMNYLNRVLRNHSK